MTDVLVEVAVERAGSLSSGLRVHADGRAETLADGEWTPAWMYPPEAVTAIAAAAADADDPPLDAVYRRPGGVSHPTTVHWRLPGGRAVAIEQFTEGLVPALDRLYSRLFELRPDPEASSLWRVRDDERTIERRVLCEPAAVPALLPLVDALYSREPPGESDAPATAESDAPLLVEVLWETDGQPSARTVVHDDGTWAEIEGATREPQRPASAAELKALRAAIAGIDWDTLPDPVTL